MRRRILRGIALVVGMALSGASGVAAQSTSRLVDGTIDSRSIAGNKAGISAKRNVRVYLPAGYDGSRRFPVVYYLHNLFETEKSIYTDHDAQGLFDAAIRDGVIAGVIVVAADFSTPAGGSFYTNSPATGNWEDLLVDELVPYVDATFRTLARPDARGLAGDRIGGYGAIRIAMRRPGVFGSVYALAPVGTGTGLTLMLSRPNWDLLANAKSIDDLKGDGFSMVFTAIFQAHLPNPDKPPLFIDLAARRSSGRLVVDAALTQRLHRSFFLDRLTAEYVENLRSLRGFKFDWGRYDPNQDHVFANEAYTRKLAEFGVPHEAEAYHGGWGDRHWGHDGRVYTDMLPFFAKHLAFE